MAGICATLVVAIAPALCPVSPSCPHCSQSGSTLFPPVPYCVHPAPHAGRIPFPITVPFPLPPTHPRFPSPHAVPPHSPLKRCPHCPHPFPVAPHCPGQRWHSGTCGRGAWWPASAGSAGHAPSCPACHDNWCHWPRCTPAGSLGSTRHRVRAVRAVRAPRPGTVPAPPFFWYRS